MGSSDIGAQLRSTREAQGLTLETMAHRTRVQPRFLTAIEENDLRSIPPKPFGRGFVRAYAREVGLDPERAVHDYFGQFPPVAPEPAAPAQKDFESPQGSSWVVPVTGIAVLVMLIAWGLRGDGTGDVAATDVVGTTGSNAAVAAAREASAAAAAPAPTPAPPVAAPPVAPSALNVVLTANAPAWVTASADGKRAIYRVLEPGSREQLTATREISVLTGNAGGVELTINGRAAGAMGKSGAVRTLRINPANAASIGQDAGTR